MVFQCQRDSFQKEYTTKVESIEKTENGSIEVTFADTVFFPEGGGQPNDEGLFTKSTDQQEFKVKNVIRRGPKAIHILSDDNDPLANLKVNDEVAQKINWERRYDHMQQHSAQHLITALFERECNYNTKAWWLGTDSSYIELDGDIKTPEMQKIEKLCNDYISQAIPVNLAIFEKPEDAGDEVTRASRGLPVDLSGPIRVIKIEGIDSNMCCGTHVKNLAQLQVIKLMSIEKGKGKVLVHFLAGNRVIKKLDDAYHREMDLNVLLNGGPDYHNDLIKKLQTTAKYSQKTIQKLSRELAAILAQQVNDQPNPKPYYFLHRSDGVEIDFANTFLRNAKPKSQIFFFITITDGIDSKSGSLVLQGSPEDVDALGGEITKILDGKGNGKNGRFNAKVTKLNKLKECEAFVKKYFENK
ncbi:hypothetical protein ACKWTF_014474 [Chironomus riparius]